MTTPSALPPRVIAFLDAHVFTVGQLEVLLLVHAAAGSPRSIAELARLSYLPVPSITPWLERLAADGVLVAADGGYRTHPDDGVLDEVAQAYARRRVSVARHLYASKEDPVVRFADAFRFRKDKDTDA